MAPPLSPSMTFHSNGAISGQEEKNYFLFQSLVDDFAGFGSPGRQTGRECGCFVAVDDGQGDHYRVPAPPVRLAGRDEPKGAPPRVGEHAGAILAELGLHPVRITDLREQGVIGG